MFNSKDKFDINISLDRDFLNGTGTFPTFLPGQVVSGKVNFTVHAEKNIDLVNITFEGQCFTEVVENSHTGTGNRSTRYREKIPLFTFTTELFRGPFKMSPTEMEWPFSFTFPESTQFFRSGHHGEDTFYDPGHQPLPPSLDVEASSIHPLKARVVYSLTAAVNPQSLLGSKEFVMPLVLLTVSKDPLAPPQNVAIRTDDQHWRSSSLRQEELSFKQKMKHVFSNDPALQTPCISFKSTSHMPRAASIWQPLSLAASIQQKITGPNDPKDPTLLLDNVHIQLKQYTSVRVKGTVFSNRSDRTSQVLATRDHRPKIKLALDDTPTPCFDAFKLADLLPETYRLAPTFKTYTINHSYMLKMVIMVYHQESGHYFKYQTKTPFVILPMDDPRASRPVASSLENLPAYGKADTQLPGYREACESIAGPSTASGSNYRTDSKVTNDNEDWQRTGFQ